MDERIQRMFERSYPEMRFGGFSDVDGAIAFYTRVQALLDPEGTAIDLGCGRARSQDDTCPTRKNLRILKGKCQHVIGLDVDEAAQDNPYIDAFHLIAPDKPWPLEDAIAQLIVCDFVMEHVDDPALLLSEAYRVLQPGGYLCIRTPNRWGYVALAAQIIPLRSHKRVLASAQATRKMEDVFPVRYRCNTRRKMSKMLRASGFSDVAVRPHEGEPAYWSFSRLLFRLMAILHRITPRLFQNSLHGWGRK